MTGRERIKAAFEPGGSPEFGAVICYEGIYIRDHWEALTRAPWWHRHSQDPEQTLAWQRDVVGQTRQDWIHVPACASREERAAWQLEEQRDGVFRVNRRTGESLRLERPLVGGWAPSGAAHSHHPDAMPSTPAEIDALLPPAPPIDGAAYRREGRADAADLLRREFPDLYPLGYVASPLWSCYALWGFEDLMVRIAESPDLVRHAAERFLDRAVGVVRAQAALGAAGVWIEECMTDMIHPEAFRSLNLPLLRRLCAEIRGCGMKAIYYYCGDPWDKLGLLLDAGADALSLEEGKKGFEIDIADVAEAARGRCAILGNLDAIGVLQAGTEEALRREIGRQAAAGRRNGRRFVMSLGSPVTPETPIERVRLYCDLAHDEGRS